MTKKTKRSSRINMQSRSRRRAKHTRSAALIRAYERQGIKIPRADGFKEVK